MLDKSKRQSIIVAFLIVLAVMVAAALMGDYYFDLNDDVLMKDILSGAFTGVPQGHNIQMLYPISAFISLFYRLIRGLDWYGIFLCFCQYFCLFVIAKKTFWKCNSNRQKALITAFLLLFFPGCIGAHLIIIQYTFTCGLLSATALFLIFTHEDGDKSLYLAVILILIAYLLRSEMLLLTLPVVLVGVLAKWFVFDRNLKKYVKVLITIAIVIICSQVFHWLAYSSPEWKEFTRLFDERTELYDFQYIPDYRENKDFYDSIGLAESEVELLVNYNFGLDDEINADILHDVAYYASSLKTEDVPLGKQFENALISYLYRLRHISFQKSYEYPMTDFPWNIIVATLYLGVILIYLFPKSERNKKQMLSAALMLLLLFACRSTLWLYIIVRGRDPIRITHPLYLMEIVYLLGFLVMKEGTNVKVKALPIFLATVIAAISIPDQISVIKGEMASRELMKDHYDALYDYFDENSENFYLIDVYTSVSAGENMVPNEATFSEKMFADVDNSFANHDLMGGWAAKSPLAREKLLRAGYDDMQTALLSDNVYMVQTLGSSTDWLMDYYQEKGISVHVTLIDSVADAFGIYEVLTDD